MSFATQPDVVIIGAGPYGLSLAAHLQSEGVAFRIFGTPLQTWRAHMPIGMFLKSERTGSDLFEPTGHYILAQYCAEEGLSASETRGPIALETFVKYALSFQQRFVPNLEQIMVAALDNRGSLFELRLASGETVKARKVVIATGLSHAAYVPPELAQLPPELRSHSSAHHDLSAFKGRTVTLLGAGQSALETAALLHEVGADVRVLARRSVLLWNEVPVSGHRSLYQRLRRPMSPLGAALGPWLCIHAPMLFRYLPQQVRFARVKKTLGPAGAWWLKERVLGRVPTMLGYALQGAETRGDKVLLRLLGNVGERCELTTDHVIAATGYRFTLAGLPFLSPRLLLQLRSEQQTPLLSSNFESSVAGLYFIGLASANQFGPVMRFLCGAGFTARRVSRHIAKHLGRSCCHRDPACEVAAPKPLPSGREVVPTEAAQK